MKTGGLSSDATFVMIVCSLAVENAVIKFFPFFHEVCVIASLLRY